MRFIDVGQEAHGFIAIGQIATGVFALGQMATGFVAVGQVARGVFVVGQGAIGVVALGMGSAGLVYSVGMIGVGGRGAGLVLPLTPSLGPTYATPVLTPGARLAAGGADQAWVKALIGLDDQGRPRIQVQGLGAVRLDARLRRSALAACAQGAVEVLAELRRDEPGWTAGRLLRIPERRITKPGWWWTWTMQMLMLTALAGVIWVACILPVLELFGVHINTPWS